MGLSGSRLCVDSNSLTPLGPIPKQNQPVLFYSNNFTQFCKWLRSTKKGFHTIAPPRLWVVSQFEILATPITGRTGTGSASDCGVIRPAPGSSASEMATWGSFGAPSAGRDTDRWRIRRAYQRTEAD